MSHFQGGGGRVQQGKISHTDTSGAHSMISLRTSIDGRALVVNKRAVHGLVLAKREQSKYNTIPIPLCQEVSASGRTGPSRFHRFSGYPERFAREPKH